MFDRSVYSPTGSLFIAVILGIFAAGFAFGGYLFHLSGSQYLPGLAGAVWLSGICSLGFCLYYQDYRLTRSIGRRI